MMGRQTSIRNGAKSSEAEHEHAYWLGAMGKQLKQQFILEGSTRAQPAKKTGSYHFVTPLSNIKHQTIVIKVVVANFSKNLKFH